jgi:DNA-binding transcriptional MerR regulator
MRAGEVAASAGVNRQTLRYYERRGLLPPPERSLGGHRLYPADTVVLLKVIKTAQRLGFTLDEVAELVGRPESGLRVRAAAKLAEIEGRISGLRAVAGTLRDAIEAGCDDLVSCASSPNCPMRL